MDEKKTVTTIGISGFGQDVVGKWPIKKKYSLASMNGRRQLYTCRLMHTPYLGKREVHPLQFFVDQSLNCGLLIFLGYTE